MILFAMVWPCIAAESAYSEAQVEGAHGERVVLQLSGRHQFQFAGYYMAKEKGYYREAGFDVAIREQVEGVDSVGQVVSGQADYGLCDSSLIADFLRGSPVMVMAAVLQHSPFVIVAPSRPGVRALRDLSGKRILAVDSRLKYEAVAMLASQGIVSSRFEIVSRDALADALSSGRADASVGYMTDEPYALQKRGVPHVAFQPRDYGVDAYGELLFTSRHRAQTKPERVRAFRTASMRGWRYAINHVGETIDHIVKAYAPEADRKRLEYEAHTLIGLMDADTVEIGYVSRERWNRSMRQIGTLAGCVQDENSIPDASDVLFRPYVSRHRGYWYRYLTALLLGAGAVILLFGVLSWLLGRMVARRTAELIEANRRLEDENAGRARSDFLIQMQRDVAVALCEAPTLQVCLERTAELILRIPGADASGIYLVDDATGELRLAAWRGVSDAYAKAFAVYDAKHPCGKEVLGGQSVWMNNEAMRRASDPATLQEGLTTIIIVPVTFDSRVIASMHVSSHTAARFSANTMATVEAVASLMGSALERLRAEGMLRQNEALFKSVAEGAFDAITLSDAEGRYLYVSPRMTELTGYASDELLGSACERLVCPGKRSRIVREGGGLLAERGAPGWQEALIGRKDGHVVPVEVAVREIEWEGRRAYVSLLKDISERKRLEQEILKVAEWERVRIGQELHDSIGQQLTGIGYLVEALGNSLKKDKSRQAAGAEEIMGCCKTAHGQLRSVVRGLLPIKPDEGLSDGLKRLAEDAEAQMGVRCTVRCDGEMSGLASLSMAYLYRIAQEAVANAVRHGRARQVQITVRRDGEQGELRIDDDGQGFRVDPARVVGSGIRIMRYRADIVGGELAVLKGESCGVSVRCTFPIGVSMDNNNREDENDG